MQKVRSSSTRVEKESRQGMATLERGERTGRAAFAGERSEGREKGL